MTGSRVASRRTLLVLAIGLLSIGVAAPLAGAVGAAGSGAALQEDGATTDDPDVTIDVDELDRDSVWRGQIVALEGFESGETVTFTDPWGSRQRTADADGRLVADTSGLAPSTWSVTGNESDVDGSFVVLEQTIDARVAPTSASDASTLNVTSNRPGTELVLHATGLTPADLTAVVDGGTVTDGRFRLSVEDATGEFAVDTAALPAGEYELEVGATDATAETTATLNVTSPLRLGDHEPTSPDDVDGLYLDVTGDGNVGQGDVATFFRRQHRSAWKRPSLFDFSRNGRVTHGDVVTLFDYVATGQLPAEPDAEFVGGPFSEQEGDVAEIPVAVEETDEAWVTVSLADHDYTATVHLADVGDETTIEANTFRMGHDEAEGTFVGEDVASFTETGELSGLPEHERFDEQLDFRTRTYTNDPREGAEPTDVSELSLDDRSTDDLTTYAAPSDALDDGVETPEDLLADASRSSRVAHGDVLIAEVEASGLYGYLQSDAASYNDTADGLGDLSISLTTEEETAFGTQVHTGDLADFPSSELLVDSANDRFFVAVPTDEIAFGENQLPVRPDGVVEVGFEVGSDNPYVVDENETVTGSVALEPALEFSDDQYAEHEGDVAEVPVSARGLGNRTDEAWVQFTLPEDDYTATVHLRNVDGETTIAANTFLMGHGEAPETFTGDDVVGFTETGELADLAPGNRFRAGTEFYLRTYTSDPTDSAHDHSWATLDLENRSTGNLTTYVAPAGTIEDGAENASDLLEHATRSDIVATGDVLVAEVEASGVYGYLNETTDDYDVSDGGLAVTFTTEQLGPFGTQQYRADLANVSNAELVADEANDRFLVTVPTTNLSLRRVSDVGDGRHTVGAGDELEVAVELDDDNPYVPDGANDSVAHTVDLQERALEFAGDFDENGRLQVANDNEATIVAETTVAPGTEGSFYIETQDSVFTGESVVQDGGTVSVPFDGSSGDAGDVIPVIEFHVDDTTSATGGVFVSETGPWIVPSGSAPSTVTVGDDASFDATVENRGTASDEVPVSVTIDGEQVGNYTVELAADASMSATFELPTDEAGEVTWEVDVGTATDSGTVTVEAPAS